MRFNQPRAYLLTWTTYGTHLHGDERGSVHRKGTTIRTKFLGPDELYERLERNQLKFPPFRIGARARRVVRLALVDACEFRQWLLLAVNVRTEHVHVVVSALQGSTKVLQVLKARATRALRESGTVAQDQAIWTEGGSRRELYLPDDVRAAVAYVLEGQGPPLAEE